MVEYERERKAAAERLEMRTTVLDRAVAVERGETGDSCKQGRALTFAEPDRWHQTVDGAALLDEIVAAIGRYVILPAYCAHATALWVVHTYLLDDLQITPRLAITSPEKGCGKTTLLDVLKQLVWRPLELSNATTPAIFRTIEMARPTLLLDEGDTFLPQNEELPPRHTKLGAPAWRRGPADSGRRP